MGGREAKGSQQKPGGREEKNPHSAEGFAHTSVLFEESMEALRIKPDGCYLDGTTGGGGHSSGILERLGSGGRLYCLDRDEEALAAAKGKLERVAGLKFEQLASQKLEQLASQKLEQAENTTPNPPQWKLVHSVYSDFGRVLEAEGEKAVDGIILDLGVSSWQLDSGERGFSYREDGPLDMRMDQSRGESARELLARIGEEELERILRDYGEEQNSRRIARAILREREQRPVTTTGQLAEVIIKAQPAKSRREKGHPAKRSFQAIRIAVNGELGELETFLEAVPDYLAAGGVLAIISFHSLEDRIVKQTFRKWENPCECPPGLPCVCGKVPLGKAVPRNGVLPGEDEQKLNPRAHSARLRIFIRAENVQ